MTTTTTSGTVQPAPASTKMSASAGQVFKKAITYILTEWPSLSLAIDNGMGGPQAREKRAWMIDHIVDVLTKGKDIELEDYLAELINQEFDTLIEDGSLEYNSHWINKFYKDCLQGKEQEVIESINKAAEKKLSLGNMRIPAPVDATQASSDDGESDCDDDVG